MTPRSRTVSKKELALRIADQMGEKQITTKRVIQAFLDSIIDELKQGNRLEFRDFGVFEVKERASRMARNPKTGDIVKVDAKNTVIFKVGKRMKEIVN